MIGSWYIGQGEGRILNEGSSAIEFIEMDSAIQETLNLISTIAYPFPLISSITEEVDLVSTVYN